MPEIPSLLTFSLVALGLVLTPGPNMIYLISRSICQGRRAGLVSLGGVALGFVFYMLCAAFGITALIFAVPSAYDALRISGVVYLLYLAWQAVKPGGGGGGASGGSGSGSGGGSGSSGGGGGGGSVVYPSRPVGSYDSVVGYAMSRIGCPYIWGAEGPDSFDCSGLVTWAYRQVGMYLPHQSEAQYAAAARVVSVSEARPGDVLWRYGHDTDPLSWAQFTNALQF